MSRQPFETKNDRPEWAIVYDVIAGKNIGDIVRFEELTDVLGRDFLTSRSPYYKAARELLEQKLRALEPVPKVGYRVVEATEQERLARKEHRSSRRKLGKAIGLVRHADRSTMAPDVRAKFDAIEGVLANQGDYIRRIDARTQRHEKAIAETRQTVAADAERLARLEERLGRLEKP